MLNMAVPVPAFDIISMDPSTMLGIWKCHLKTYEINKLTELKIKINGIQFHP